ncbi:hypothetical protein OUZ56_006500 [Daphnia magna]|uniref:Uncharacterized protein n=1 Tax=Daphnia magna TaxID=35525 RepID=A0ABQ9YVV1_9CRUS|nr:hypothetical protein OUZ56_006500 [Daphnia magna]
MPRDLILSHQNTTPRMLPSTTLLPCTTLPAPEYYPYTRWNTIIQFEHFSHKVSQELSRLQNRLNYRVLRFRDGGASTFRFEILSCLSAECQTWSADGSDI